jgi:hypothetical protein
METTSRIPVLEGRLPDFRLEELLQVVSIGRQYTGIELREEDASPVGAIYLKSGQVITADDRRGRGRDAFFRRAGRTSSSSFVWRRRRPRILSPSVSLRACWSRHPASRQPGPWRRHYSQRGARAQRLPLAR